MNVAQVEHFPTLYTDPLPMRGTLDRLEVLTRRRRMEVVHITNLTIDLTTPHYLSMGARIATVNMLNQAEARLRGIIEEIVEVAGQVYAEYAVMEVTQ